MDWKALFLTSNGRLGQKDFWIAFLILFVVAFVGGMIPLLNLLIGLALIFPGVCILAKRLHDFGKTGWLAAAPYAVSVAAMLLAAVMGGMAMMAGGLGGDGAAAMAAAGGMGMMALVMFVAFAANLGFLLWVGLSRGDPQPNAYGPPPATLFGGASPTAV